MDDATTLRPATDPSMDLLGDLELRLDALKKWQRESAAHAASVEERERELEAGRRALEEASAELDREREQAAEAAASLEARRAEAEQEQRASAQRRAELDEEAEALRERGETLSRQRDEAEAERARTREEAARLAEDREALQRDRDDLEERGRSVAGQEAEAAAIEGREAALGERSAALQAEREALDARAAELETRDAELEERRVGLGEAEAGAAELAERSAALDAEREALRLRSAELDAFRDELETELQRLNTLESDLQERSADLDAREQRLIDATGKHAADLEASSREQSDHAAEAAAAAETLATLSARLEARETELDGSRKALGDAAEEVRRLTDALAEAEEAAMEMQAQAESGPAAPPAEPAAAGTGPASAVSEEEVAAMRAELDKRAHNLKRAKRKIMDLQDEVRNASDRNGESAIFSSGELDLSEVTELRMKLETREQELAIAKEKLEASAAEVARLRVRVDELLKRGGRSGSALPGDTPDHAARALELDELAAQVTADRNRVLERKSQLKAADALIRSRREKIRDYIKEFRGNHGRARGGGGIDPGKIAQLEQERSTLLEVKRFLQASEAQMVKRWAVQRTASVVATLVIAVAAAAAVSWTAAGVIAQPLYQSTLTLEVREAPGEEALPPGVWLSGYQRDLLSEPVLQEVQNQLQQRDLRLAGSVEGLGERLRGRVGVRGEREALEITFTDPDPKLVVPVLDAVGRGLLIHHMAQDRRAGRMSDTASIRSEAVARDQPVRDERVRFFGMILGGFAVLALLAAIPARLLAGRASRQLPEGAVAELAVLEHPSPLVTEAMEASKATGGGADDEGDVIKPVFRF
ncbi:hypothetical protein [Phycisphaera mikurensis]|uniref:Uncharacterized protein n=1 Tax=Phycisphaera mikurensis (strain NBRC 102666 / KCTC 22515 / FYK2301M01) TaxID=1142394 RepID=I0IGU7_PHYMF|nr:hypothetical protein [Phycisphaera mikurensis]MBB6440742.1 chromosome segregation ATPase [Phycisphaera mikurensis]BAM04485.1 hypothetical protein PSMK_23260 [Phycisphaera mikurensis NBRC 102666]